MKAASILAAGIAVATGATGAWAQERIRPGAGAISEANPQPSPMPVTPWRVVPFTLTSNRITQLELRINHPLELRMTAAPSSAAAGTRVFVTLRGPSGRVLANRHGSLPLSLTYRVTAPDLTAGTRWRVEMLSTGSASGTLKLWLRGLGTQPSPGTAGEAKPQPAPPPARRVVFSISRSMQLHRGVSLVLDVPVERPGRILARAQATESNRGRLLRLEVRRWDGTVLARKLGVLPLTLHVNVPSDGVRVGRPWRVRLRNLHRRPVRAELTTELVVAPEAVPSA